MALELDRERIAAVVAAVADRLPGEWLLVGGALVALWIEPRRTTEDVDLVGLAGSAAERLALLELAADLGLPVEALNSAADFFVHRIAGWREETELFHAGACSKILRPTPTLFVLLKVSRLSERDLADCLGAVAKAKAEGLRLDRARIQDALAALPVAEDAAVAERRAVLRAALSP